jgi:DNA-binding XRE family transcriptional regulator
MKKPVEPKDRWDGNSIQALRRHLGLTQDGLSEQLGTRQQTISEWETGMYQPRGASAKLLSIIAEKAKFKYDVSLTASGDTATSSDAAADAAPKPLKKT